MRRGLFGGIAFGCVVLVLGSAPGAGQAGRDQFERVAGIREEAAHSFFGRLRAAVARDERRAVCQLLAYPLASSGRDVRDAADCEARYESLFTVAVRKAIGKQMRDELFVNARGVMIGLGELWFGGRCATPPCGEADIRVLAITSSTEGLVPPAGKVLLACRAGETVVHVSADGAGGAGMRLWRSGGVSGPAAVAVPRHEEMQYDDLCDARAWTFVDGSTRYTLSTLSCEAHQTPPPMGSIGEFVVKRDGSDELRTWCEQ